MKSLTRTKKHARHQPIRGWDVEAGGQPIKVNIWDFGGQGRGVKVQTSCPNAALRNVLDGRKDERAGSRFTHRKFQRGLARAGRARRAGQQPPALTSTDLFCGTSIPVSASSFIPPALTGRALPRSEKFLLRSWARCR